MGKAQKVGITTQLINKTSTKVKPQRQTCWPLQNSLKRDYAGLSWLAGQDLFEALEGLLIHLQFRSNGLVKLLQFSCQM